MAAPTKIPQAFFADLCKFLRKSAKIFSFPVSLLCNSWTVCDFEKIKNLVGMLINNKLIVLKMKFQSHFFSIYRKNKTRKKLRNFNHSKICAPFSDGFRGVGGGDFSGLNFEGGDRDTGHLRGRGVRSWFCKVRLWRILFGFHGPGPDDAGPPCEKNFQEKSNGGCNWSAVRYSRGGLGGESSSTW